MVTPINTIDGITYFGYKSGPSPGIDITRSQLVEFLDTALGAANNEVLPNVMGFHARIPSREFITGAVTTTASDGKTRVVFDNNLRIAGVYPHNETTPGPFVPVQNPYVIPNLTGERVVYMCASSAGLGILQIRLNSGIPDQNGYVFNYIGYSTEAYTANYPMDLHCIVSYKVGDSTDNGVFGITNDTSTAARTITPRPNVSCRENQAKPASDVVLDESIKAQPFIVWLDRPLAVGAVTRLIGNPHELYISCGRLGPGSILMRVIGHYLLDNAMMRNTGYGDNWDKSVPLSAPQWQGTGNSISRWLSPSSPGTTWQTTARFCNTFAQRVLYGRYRVDNQLLSVTVNGGPNILTAPAGNPNTWTDIIIPAGIVGPLGVGEVAITFTISGQSTPTGFRLEWWSATHIFGTYLSKGGLFAGNYICQGGCDVFYYWRTIRPIVKYSGNHTLVVVDNYWYVSHEDQLYQIDFIYPNNFLSNDLSDARTYPAGPFAPHGIGILYVPPDGPCLQTSNFLAPAYGSAVVSTKIIPIPNSSPP